MSSMLEQALVDATALREAALKSAEAAVLEAAQPKIEETLKALLEQDEEDGLDDLLGGGGGGLEPDMGAGEVGGVADSLPLGVTDGENMCPCPDEEEEIEIDFGELERQMASDEQAADMGQAELAQDLNLSAPGDELGAEMGAEDEEEIDLDEETLFSILAENDGEEEGESGHPDKECHSAHPNMTHAEWTHKGNIEEGFLSKLFGGGDKNPVQSMKGDMMGSMKDTIAAADNIKAALAQQGITDFDQKIESYGADYEANPNDVRSIVPYALVLSDALKAINLGGEGDMEEAKMTRDMIAQASKDAHMAHLASKGDQPEAKPAPRHKSMGQEFDLDADDELSSLELAREGKMIVTKEKLMEIVRSSTKDLFTTQAEKDKEISNLKSFVRRLSEELKDTNLQNARLLYTNQILESVSLNERQKRKIVEAVSKAGSVEEAKVIYETLSNSVGSSKKKKPQSLREAVEKRSTPLIARRNKPENAPNPVAERMQKLAGITKK